MDKTGRTSSPGDPEQEERERIARDQSRSDARGAPPNSGDDGRMDSSPPVNVEGGVSRENDTSSDGASETFERDWLPNQSRKADERPPKYAYGDEPTVRVVRNRQGSDGAAHADAEHNTESKQIEPAAAPEAGSDRDDGATQPVEFDAASAPFDGSVASRDGEGDDVSQPEAKVSENAESSVDRDARDGDEPTLAPSAYPAPGGRAASTGGPRRADTGTDTRQRTTESAEQPSDARDRDSDYAGVELPHTYVPVSRPLTRSQQRMLFEVQRRSRRRRRYTMFVRRTARARQAARSASITRAAWASVVVMLGLIVAVLTASMAAAASYYQSEYGLIKGLQHEVASKDSVRIYDSKGVLLYELRGDGAQHSVSLANIPITVVNATVAIEDHEFWNNGGIDFYSIGRAAISNLQSHGVSQGGSTITQQLIKQQVLQSNKAELSRKIDEAILALGMTYQGVYTKRQILELYLNSIPYSPTAYGIDAAAQQYFGYQDDPDTGITAAQHLDLAQSAMLAGIPQNPNTNDPLLHPGKAHARMGDVLNAMVMYGYITRAQADAAWAEAAQPNFFHPTTQEQNKAPHFVYYVLDQLQDMIQTGQLRNLSRSGLSVYTTLDMQMQNQVQAYMKQHLYGTDRGGYFPYRYIKDSNVTNSTAVMVEHSTGDIKVLLGSVDYYSTAIDGKFDVATQGYRGPGSSFKPLVYATAFEKGWFPAMTTSDMPTTFWDEGRQTVYRPLDFTYNEFRGEITLRTALQFSLNIPAIRTMQFAGVNDVRNNAERWGITSWAQGATWGLSSVLGALDVHPIDMVQAYAVLANYGGYVPLHGINKIVDSNDDILFQYHTPTPIQVMSPQVAFMVTNVLSDNPARADDFGTCSPLYLDPSQSDCYYFNGNSPNAWPAAAKTGTGQDFRDDWTMGYTRDYTMGVWVGNNNNTPMLGIDGVTGAAPIWHNSMLYAEHNLKKRPFEVPAGVHKARFCSDGICTTDWFLDGTQPPDNIGNGGPVSVPCITFLETGGWEYASPGQCDGTAHLRPVHY